MNRLTVSLDDEHVHRLKGRVRAGEAASKSDALRQILDENEELHNECENLHKKCESLRARRDELRNQLQERGEVEEKVTELVERTERQDDALAQVLERQQQGVVGRAKRWLFGSSGDGTGAQIDASE